MSNYRDDIFQQMLEQLLYPNGRTTYDKKTDTDIENEANLLSSNDVRGASMQASMTEDQQLRNQLGSKRSLRKGERMPRGSYALAEYPGLRYDIDNASRGANPRGGLFNGLIPGSEEDKKLQELRRLWAQNQGAMMPGGNFVSRMGRR